VEDEFLPDEFVLDANEDVPAPLSARARAAEVYFAGPSDPPPSTMRSVHGARSPARRIQYPLIAFALMAVGGVAILLHNADAPDEPVEAASVPVVHSALDQPRHEVPVAASALTASTASLAPTAPSGVASVENAAPLAPAPLAPAPSDSAVSGDNEAAAGVAKRAAQAALEDGLTAQAVYAGERSVALDPGDAEAWLILGAAYQQRRAWADARRCFKSCVDQATHGPRGECAALLR
jgi:hypothetical protein